MPVGLRNRASAAALALVAAFFWATYYLFVLAAAPRTQPSSILFFPFLGGGLCYAGWLSAHGKARDLLRLFAEPKAALRLLLMFSCQTSILAATYLTGPVDASLLSLIGDVVGTPLVVAIVFAEGRSELRSPLLAVGFLLSLFGGTLAIAGGHAIAGVHDLGWVLVVVVPLSVAFYFPLSARAGTPYDVTTIVGQTMLACALACLAFAPLVPGGLGAIVRIPPSVAALLLLNGVVSFFLAPICYFRAIDRAGLVFPPMLMTGIPVFTLLLSAWVLHLPVAPLALLGVPLAAVGGVVALAAGGPAPSTASR